eukprot:SAG31_NODE_44235_length_263_cov_1.262195_1_plen_49_part_10
MGQRCVEVPNAGFKPGGICLWPDPSGQVNNTPYPNSLYFTGFHDAEYLC